jgi:osmotically-inducible protein OsmY
VIAKDGVVTLRGHVNSWEERKAVDGVVRHALGVREVKDELTYG